jgi:quinol monooxygenase YgiN
MVKHIVMYTLKEGVDKSAAVEKIASLLEPLVGQIEGLRWMEINETFQGGMDYVLYSEFESREALLAYAEHPLHLAAKDQFFDLIATRVAGDYEY